MRAADRGYQDRDARAAKCDGPLRALSEETGVDKSSVAHLVAGTHARDVELSHRARVRRLLGVDEGRCFERLEGAENFRHEALAYDEAERRVVLVHRVLAGRQAVQVVVSRRKGRRCDQCFPFHR